MSKEHGELIGFVPDHNPTSKKEWKESLDQGFQTYRFKGDSEKGAELLQAFSEGVQYVYDTYGERQAGEGLEEPTIVLITKDNIMRSPFAANDTQIRIKASFVEARSQDLPEQNVEFTKADGELAFKGKTIDFFRLAGVEEGHHTVFKKVKGSEDLLNPNETDLASYDASDPEWHGLRWQSRFAREKGLPDETQALLKTRMEAAKQIREGKGKKSGKE